MTSHSRAERAADARPPESPAIAKPTLCMINYNGERFLRNSLRSAVAQADRFVEILLDRRCLPGSQPARSSNASFPMVRIVRLPENRGPAAARNVALREARTELALLVDNDVSLAPGCVDELVTALAAHPDAAIAAPAVLYAHDPRSDPIRWSRQSLHRPHDAPSSGCTAKWQRYACAEGGIGDNSLFSGGSYAAARA